MTKYLIKIINLSYNEIDTTNNYSLYIYMFVFFMGFLFYVTGEVGPIMWLKINILISLDRSLYVNKGNIFGG